MKKFKKLLSFLDYIVESITTYKVVFTTYNELQTDSDYSRFWYEKKPTYKIYKCIIGIVVDKNVCHCNYADLSSANEACEKLNSGGYYEGKYFPLSKVDHMPH